MLDWDDVRFFLAISRAGTLTAAARTLGVTQPTVGRRIAAFEERLGAKLFTAKSAGYVLSATGKRLVEHAERMESEALAAERVAAGRDSGVRGRVTITANEWVLDLLLAPVVASLLSRHPDLEVELLGDVRHLNLVRREADLAIRPARFEHQDVIEVAVGSVAFGLYASEAYLAAHGAPDFSRQCAGSEMIAMSEALVRPVEADWLTRVASHARVVARANGRLAMARLAAAGAGIACLPGMVGGVTRSLRAVATPSPGPERQLWLAVHRDARTILLAARGHPLDDASAHEGEAPRRRAKVRAICFDVFTLLDPRSVTAAIRQVWGDDAEGFRDAWATKQFQYAFLRAAAGSYADFRQVTDDALAFVAAARRRTLSSAERRRLVDACSQLDPWPDVRDRLVAFKNSGLLVAPLTNYSPRMLDAALEHARLGDLFDARISTSAARTFKPHPQAYALGPSTLGLDRSEIAFAAFAGWDAAGGRWFGYPTFWVNRVAAPREELAPPPDGTGAAFSELASFVATWGG